MLLPFFARGKNMLSIMMSFAYPLESVHLLWRVWALDRIIEASATSQPIVLKWYLEKTLSKYFSKEDDEFEIVEAEASYYASIFNDQAEQNRLQNTYGVYWSFENNSDRNSHSGIIDENWLYAYDRNEATIEDVEASLAIIAPELSTQCGLSQNEYKREVKKCVEKYLVYKINYEIKIR